MLSDKADPKGRHIGVWAGGSKVSRGFPVVRHVIQIISVKV